MSSSTKKKLFQYSTNKHRKCIYSESQIQKNDRFCDSFCLDILHLKKVLGFDFRSAGLNLYYQRVSRI